MRQRVGFTIVELLIVIVVIAVLALITVVAFNGIRDRANDSAAKTAASQAAKKMEAGKALNSGSYPTSLNAAEISNQDGKLQYSGSDTTYCITATEGSKSYKVSSSAQSPQSGGCPGHGQGGGVAITNLMTSPSLESGTVSPWNAGGQGNSTFSLDTSVKRSGSTSLRVTSTNSGAYAGVRTAASITSGTTYVLSAWVYVPSGQPDVRMQCYGAVTTQGTALLSAKDTWSRLTLTCPATSTGSLNIGLVSTATAASQYFYADDIMVTSGATVYEYADGNSTDWVWNGTPNASTSTGPAL